MKVLVIVLTITVWFYFIVFKLTIVRSFMRSDLETAAVDSFLLPRRLCITFNLSVDRILCPKIYFSYCLFNFNSSLENEIVMLIQCWD